MPAGVPYKDELDRIAVYVPQNNDLADLNAHAAAGIANPQALGSALEALVPEPCKRRATAIPAAKMRAASGPGSAPWSKSATSTRWTGPISRASAAADAKAGDLKAAIARLEEPGGDLPPELARVARPARISASRPKAAMAQLAAAVTADHHGQIMIRLLVRFLLLAVAAAGFAWIADRPGTIVIRWLNREIETSVLAGLAGLIFAVLALWFCSRLLRRLIGTPGAIGGYMRFRKARRGYESLSRGIIAAGAGDGQGAPSLCRRSPPRTSPTSPC